MKTETATASPLTEPARPEPGRRSRRRMLPGVAGVVIVALVCLFGTTFQQYLAGLVLIYGLSALGLDWLMGRAGQVSIGNAALMAIGSFVTGALDPYGWAPFPVPLIVSGVVGAVAGLVIGLPSLRLKGTYFALATLALHFLVVFGAQRYEQGSGNVSGLTVRQPAIGSFVFDYGPSYVLLLAAITAVTMLVLHNMYRRLPGRMWRAIRESELAASTIQVNVRRWKLSAFVGSSALIAISGSLLAYYTGTVSSDTFSLDFAITFLVMIIIGGMGSMTGALFGAAVVTLASQALSLLSDMNPDSGWLQTNLPLVQNGLYGFIVLFCLLYLPRGVVPSVAGLVAARRSRSAASGPAGSGSAGNGPAVARTAVTTGAKAGALEIRDLRVTYRNGARALDGVDLSVPEGEVIAVVGRNGAGKSTLLRSISGFLSTEEVATAGSVRLFDRELIGSGPLVTSRLGVVLVPERDKVFPSLTVADHLRHLGDADVAREAMPDAWSMLEKRWKSPAGLLSGGERQLLALAMAASLEPKVLLVDEMSLGLAPVMIGKVAEAIRQLRAERSLTIVVVEQNVPVAVSLAQRVYHLDGGRLFDHEEATSE